MLIELLHKRTSVRKYVSKKIPKQIVSKILEAGRLSPSGGDEQPWLFGVIDNEKIIEKIADLSYKQKFINSAPLLIVLCVKNIPAEKGGRDVMMARFPSVKEDISTMSKHLYEAIHLEEHQTKIPGTHMVLQAIEEGIGTCWVSYFNVEAVTELLELPEDYMASEIIAFGYPKDNIRPREKKQLDEIVFYNQYIGG